MVLSFTLEHHQGIHLQLLNRNLIHRHLGFSLRVYQNLHSQIGYLQKQVFVLPFFPRVPLTPILGYQVRFSLLWLNISNLFLIDLVRIRQYVELDPLAFKSKAGLPYLRE